MLRDMQEVKRRIAAYCARRERCEKEVRLKLEQWQPAAGQVEEILTELRELKLVDNTRYCLHMTETCLYDKKWGRDKIRLFLFNNGIADELISKALCSIPEAEYLLVMEQVAAGTANPAGIYRRLVSRGFEEEIVNSWMQKKYLSQ